MDKKKLKEFIKEVAEIEELKPKKDRAVRLDDDALDVVKVDNEWVEITAKSNPTLGFKFKKLKDKNATCELGCGDIVTNQLIEKRLSHTPMPHWRTRCNNCGHYVSPDGVGFIQGAHEIQSAYVRFFRGEKVQPEPKVEIELRQHIRQEDGREYIQTTTSTGYIREYK